MKTFARAVLLLLVLMGTTTALHAQALITINFDDISFGSQPAEQYALQGIHFLGGDGGIQNGLTNGDSGNWGVDGTAGPFFLGFNGPSAPDVLQSDPYKEKISFDFTATSISLDVSRTSGSTAADTFILQAYAGSTLVDAQSVTLNAINTWQTVTVTGSGITNVLLIGQGAGYHPYGVDNLQFTPVPEPPLYALLGLGLLGLGWLRRRH